MKKTMPDSILEAIIALEQAVQYRVDHYANLEQELLAAEQAFSKAIDQAIQFKNPGQLRDIRVKQKSKATQIHDRKLRVKQNFDQKWLAALQLLDRLCKRVRLRQPHLNELQQRDFNQTRHFPDALAFGRLRLSYENWRGFVPRLVPFPLKQALWLTDTSENRLRVHQLLLRLMSALPTNLLRVTAFDPLRLGTSLSPFLPLLKEKRPFPEQRVLTRADEIEHTLKNRLDYVENLLQVKFKGGVTHWGAYNVANPEAPLPYELLLLFDVPEQLTDNSLWYLRRLLEHGASCGVLPVLMLSEQQLEDRRYSGLRESLQKFAQPMNQILPATLVTRRVTWLSIAEEHEFWPGPKALGEVICWLAEEYQRAGLFTRELAELWNQGPVWGETSEAGLSAAIGWNQGGEEVYFALGGVNTEHHALLAGRSGSGKSNLLHVLIHSLCHRYSPSELKIYLLDYKQGTEFALYARPPLPQAALVATESDPEYGVTVLTHLAQELEQRASEFKQYGTRDLQEYRQRTNKVFPRLLLIIDEFQLLFSEGRQVAEGAEKLLNLLLRQGRAYGIHVLLATQTLKGIQSLSMGQLISQIGCRIALACSEEDSAMILGNTNWEAATLNSPPEGLLNDANGVKSANRRFQIPFAERSICAVHQNEIYQLAYDRGYHNRTKVFSGSQLPAVPSPERFKQHQVCRANPEILLGQELNFQANDFALPLENRPGGHLLVVGYDRKIQGGLLLATLRSLQNHPAVAELIYYNARGEQPELPELNQTPGVRLAVRGMDWSGDLTEFRAECSPGCKVLIIDGLDYAKMFQVSPTGFRPMKKDEPPLPADTLKAMMEEGPARGFFVISFVDNWRRCSSGCKDLLPYFDLRLGFGLNEDDAGALVSGNIGKLRGLEQGNKAIFVDRLKNQQVWLRPFVVQGVT